MLDEYLADPQPPASAFQTTSSSFCLGGRGLKEGSGQECFGIAIIDTDGTINKNDTLSTFAG